MAQLVEHVGGIPDVGGSILPNINSLLRWNSLIGYIGGETFKIYPSITPGLGLVVQNSQLKNVGV